MYMLHEHVNDCVLCKQVLVHTSTSMAARCDCNTPYRDSNVHKQLDKQKHINRLLYKNIYFKFGYLHVIRANVA